jgi:hypothetical protein
VPEVANFLEHLRVCELAPSSIDGYRTAIGSTIKNLTGRDLGHDPFLSSLLHRFHLERPRTRPKPPDWDLAFVLECLTKAPFEPMDQTKKLSVRAITLKTAFLVAFATARRRGELHALLHHNFERTYDWSSITLHTDPTFMAKTQIAATGTGALLPVEILAISHGLGPDMPEDLTLCPVRALRYYFKKTDPFRRGRRELFISMIEKRDKSIVPSTISGWIRDLILDLYGAGGDAGVQRRFSVKPHEVHSLAVSWAAANRASMREVMEAANWRTHTTFTDYYLRDMTNIRGKLMKLGPLNAAQGIH